MQENLGAGFLDLEIQENHQGLPEDFDAPILSVCQRGNASLTGLLFLKSLGILISSIFVPNGTLAVCVLSLICTYPRLVIFLT